MADLLAKNRDEWITLELFSTGGDLVAGYALYDWLIANVPRLQTVGYGIVGSMAVAIFLTGQWRAVSRNCEFILHPVHLVTDEPVSMELADHVAIVEDLEQIQRHYNDTLRRKMDHPPSRKKLDALVGRTTIIGPRKAKRWGLVHEILPR